MVDTAPHRIRLTGTEWFVWQDGLLRSAGFPAEMAERFAAPELAEVADAHLAGSPEGAGDAATLAATSTATFDAAFDRAVQEQAHAVYATAADPNFREALVWQNPGALNGPLGVLRDGPAARRNERRRRREEIVAKYAQRYSMKNDSIGFFGPMCWVTLHDTPGVTVDGAHGPGLTSKRVAFFEWWAVNAIAQVIAEDPAVRPWLPVALQPQLTLTDRKLLRPNADPVQLSAAQAAVLARCDGRFTAAEVARAVAGADGVRAEGDVLAILDQYAKQGIVRWEFALPVNLSAEAELSRQVAAIGDPVAAAQARDTLARMVGAKDALAAAAGPEAAAAAMAALESEFTGVTGLPPHHRGGQTYAGRTLCHLDAVRDAHFSFGGKVLAALRPLDQLLRSTRWLTGTLAEVYRAELARIHAELTAESGTDTVPFPQLWYLAQGLLSGHGKIAGVVIEEFLHRWTVALGLHRVPAGTTQLELTTDELSAAVARLFPAKAPGWRRARIHAPDVHLCAADADALARGEFTVVLGELHTAMAALDTDFFRLGHPEPDRLLRAMRADVPGSVAHPLLPLDWPRLTARNADWMYGEHDVQLGFTAAPGAKADRLLPITALTVSTVDGELIAQAADGRRWPLLEMFAELIAFNAFDTWKLAGAGRQTPRVAVDGLVLIRRTWRCTVAETGLAEVSGERARYLAVRAFASALGLPQRVFVRVATEIKPCFIDLTSPVFARILCNLVRSAGQTGGSDTEVAVAEMLPTPDQAWLTDSAGHRYCSELRIHVVDPVDPDSGGNR